jgi:hypothetical protein
MKFPTLLFCPLFFSIELLSQVPTFDWANKMGGILPDRGNSITTDLSGNVYITGSFWGTADFDPGVNTTLLFSSGGDDIFISKYDASGNLIWTKGIGSSGNETGKCVNVDLAGNVYESGRFNSDTIDFDPGPAIYNVITSGAEDIFISKFNSSGNLIWAKQMGGLLTDECLSSIVDQAGNIYSTGMFQQSADINPGPGSHILTTPGGGDFDVFLTELDSSGNFVWAVNIGGTAMDLATSITIDLQGNLILAGDFRYTADFDPGSGVFSMTAFNTTSDIFILKLDPAGNFIWAKQISGQLAESTKGMSLDLAGSIYLTGNFYGTADFDPGPGIYNLTPVHSNDDIFICKLDSNGNFAWAQSFGGSGSDYGVKLTNDTYGNVYCIGLFTGPVDFDAGIASHILYDYLTRNTYITCYDSSGIFLWGKNMEGNGTCIASSITIDIYNNVYLTGGFSRTIDFDPDSAMHTLQSFGDSLYVDDIFILKLNQLTLDLDEMLLMDEACVYPNPTKGDFNIRFNKSEDVSLRVFNIAGKLISDETFKNVFSINYDIYGSPGIYFIELSTPGKPIQKFKVIKG